MDIADIASAREDDLRAQALNKIPKHTGISRTHCIHCDSAIPAQRRALGGVIRCIDCQTVYEHQSKSRSNP